MPHMFKSFLQKSEVEIWVNWVLSHIDPQIIIWFNLFCAIYESLYLLFPDSPPGAVECVAEDLLARPQGRGVVTAGGGANVNSFGNL